MKTISKLVSSSLIVSVLLCNLSTTFAFYFNQESQQGSEQLEQKYESTSNDGDNYLSDNDKSSSSSSSSDYIPEYKPYSNGNNRLLGMFGGGSSSYSNLNNFKSPAQNLKEYDSKASSSDQYGSLKSITSIPSGSMFSMGGPNDKANPLQFESPFSKQPYSIVFRTQSMPVKIKQQHHTMPAPEVEYVRSQEEAHRIQHEVIRPVIQEVHEIIQPYRRVVQEVRPVIENIHTIVAKGDSRNGGNGGNGGQGQQGPLLSGGSGGGSQGGYGGGASHGSAGHGNYQGSSYAASENRPRVSPVHNHRFSQGVAQSQYKPSQFASSYYRGY